MSITEKTAYLRGLADGMKLAERDSDETRLLLAVVDAMEELAQHVEANRDSINIMADELEELDDVVSGLEENLEGMEDEDGFHDDDDEPEEEVTEYQLECPECGGEVVVDEETVDRGETTCPSCGAHLSIDVGFEDEEE